MDKENSLFRGMCECGHWDLRVGKIEREKIHCFVE